MYCECGILKSRKTLFNEKLLEFTSNDRPRISIEVRGYKITWEKRLSIKANMFGIGE